MVEKRRARERRREKKRKRLLCASAHSIDRAEAPESVMGTLDSSTNQRRIKEQAHGCSRDQRVMQQMVQSVLYWIAESSQHNLMAGPTSTATCSLKTSLVIGSLMLLRGETDALRKVEGRVTLSCDEPTPAYQPSNHHPKRLQ